MANPPLYKMEKEIILVVDDVPANHEIIQSFLDDIGVSYESAFDGMMAITMHNTAPDDYYSLILMDVNLPGMNGLTTALKLRSMGVRTPILGVTAADKDARSIRSAKSNGIFDNMLFKPFNSSEFYAAISPYIKCFSPPGESGDSSRPMISKGEKQFRKI